MWLKKEQMTQGQKTEEQRGKEKNAKLQKEEERSFVAASCLCDSLTVGGQEGQAF